MRQAEKSYYDALYLLLYCGCDPDNSPDLNLKPQSRSYTRESPKDSSHSGALCKSDVNVVATYEMSASCSYIVDRFGHSDGDYYKKYEHDELPVREYSVENEDSIKGGKGSLTNSELDKLEQKIYSKVSEELQTDDSSKGSLESNIKIFRTTVQEIFDNFYASMNDFELYKKRFHEILEKNREDSLEDMEDFIKDIIQHILDSESSATNNVKSTEVLEITYDTHDTCLTHSHSSGNGDTVASDAIERTLSKSDTSASKEEIFNIFLLSCDPCVQIKMKNRNLFSEINIKAPRSQYYRKQVASADNFNNLAAKNVELENFSVQRQEVKPSDVDIPVKVSYAKKNIHLDEDFQNNGEPKSIITRLCSYLCRKFRKTTLG